MKTVLRPLMRAGLSEKESKVYLSVLELGEANIAQITRKSQIRRSTVYDMLESLKEKGFVAQSRRKKRLVFYAENPQKMVDTLEEKKRELKDAMPQIISMMNVLEKKPKISYYEGRGGVREIFEDTLRYAESEVLTWLPFPYLDLGEDYFWKHYNPERVKKKIWMRVLAPAAGLNREIAAKMENYLVKTRFIEDEAFLKFDMEIKIYGQSKIGIISHTEELGIIIESRKIHDGFRAIFESGWTHGSN